MVEPSSLLFFFTLHLLVTVVFSAEFTIVNNCNYTIWPASYTTSGNATLATTGFILKPGENSTTTAPPYWAGRFWGRTLCTTNSISRNFSCVTGDCGSGKVACDGRSGSSPVTIAEFSLNSVNNQDFYDVSLVDGYNIPMEVTPLGGSGKCNSTGCPTDLNTVCPTELKVTENGTIVACQGPCAAFNLQFFCCVGNHSMPNTCEPSVYAQIFKTTCPQAYSYVYDNKTSTFACPATDYHVVFCPATNNASLESLDQGVSVSVGASLTAGNDTTRWLSPSGDFAFGFYQLPDELFLLAIWYDKIQNDAIIWYANGDNPAPKGSRLVLNDFRGLVLTNPQGLELWRSDFTGTISNGLMNDVGNFQLRDKKNVTIWDSFSHPTDTLVPNQVMELNRNLFSRQGALNFSHGRFKFHLQEDGNLVLNVINLPSNYSYDPYYKSGTSDAENQTNAGQRLIFDKSGFLYIEKIGGDNFSISNLNVRFSTDEFYYKATINYDGVFTISVYPKDPKRGQSWVIAKTIPENICLYSTFRGEGVCGFNSICTITNDQRPNCTCPDEYSPIDSNNMYAGCIPNFQVICQAGGNLGPQDNLYTMKDLPNTDWPESDYEYIIPSNIQECKESCLQDCLCVLVHFEHVRSACWKKKLPLSYGRNDPAVKGISMMKLMKSDHMSSLSKEKKDHDTLVIVISVLLGSSMFVILTLLWVIFFGCPCNRKKIKSGRNNESFVDNNLRRFSFKEIVEATRNFKEQLGRGSCSIVYKGTIEMMINVAVKKLDKLIQDSDKEFKTEMSVIGQTHHRNLVRLLGYCNEGQHRILVYELMSNGTLASFLFTPLKPDWNRRVQIIPGIARGLVYLHEGCCTQIIHCDIKPQNILLDDQYNARISDFGLSKLLLINQSHTETEIRGTKGYVAPDWFRSAPITSKVDTYSFGVLLLEIICCRKNVEKEFFTEEKGILTDWVYDCYKTKRLDILLEKDNEVSNDMMCLEKFVMIAIWCIQEDPSLRPTMKEVLLMLEGIVEVAAPPSPYLYGSISCN